MCFIFFLVFLVFSLVSCVNDEHVIGTLVQPHLHLESFKRDDTDGMLPLWRAKFLLECYPRDHMRCGHPGYFLLTSLMCMFVVAVQDGGMWSPWRLSVDAFSQSCQVLRKKKNRTQCSLVFWWINCVANEIVFIFCTSWLERVTLEIFLLTRSQKSLLIRNTGGIRNVSPCFLDRDHLRLSASWLAEVLKSLAMLSTLFFYVVLQSWPNSCFATSRDGCPHTQAATWSWPN